MGRKIGVILLTVLFVLSVTFMGYAFWTIQSRTDNVLTMASYKAQIVETYKMPAHVNPSESVEKRVHVKNDGTVDILVRVSVTKAFGTRDADGTLHAEAGLDPDMIEIKFNDRLWKAQDDGWFYYKEILRAGERTQEPLMESFTLSAQAGNEYRGKDAEIIVCMESVQADRDAASVWNTRLEELGIVFAKAPAAEKTAVTYLGREQGFTTNTKNTDLFAAFKNLTPGCGRTQKILVENKSAENVEIFLRAEQTEQETMSAEQAELVRRLLTEYAVIEITEGKRLLYRGTVCNALPGRLTSARAAGRNGAAPVQAQTAQNGAAPVQVQTAQNGEVPVQAQTAQNRAAPGTSMLQDISLGQFAAGSGRNLVVKLSLSPEMDNRLQKLTGKVAWIFSARGEDGKVTQLKVPVTADSTRIMMWAALLITSALAAAIAVWAERRDRRKEHENFKEDD